MTFWSIIIIIVALAGIAFVALKKSARIRRENRDPELRIKRMRHDAQRFSRLLVSEIKLYNEETVAEGREYRDLYIRLRDDIDRSRALYDKRIDLLVVGRDYFHEAVVEILCGNDAAVLGTAYPGPRTHAVQ